MLCGHRQQLCGPSRGPTPLPEQASLCPRPLLSSTAFITSLWNPLLRKPPLGLPQGAMVILIGQPSKRNSLWLDPIGIWTWKVALKPTRIVRTSALQVVVSRQRRTYPPRRTSCATMRSFQKLRRLCKGQVWSRRSVRSRIGTLNTSPDGDLNPETWDPELRKHVEGLVLNSAVRELFLSKMVELLRHYETFVYSTRISQHRVMVC